MTPQTKEKIDQLVASHPVFLFMKGEGLAPQCTFSSVAVAILKRAGVEDFGWFNVLEDMEMREAIKEYSDWPTIPQLYINGQFIGGSDIMQELLESGELQKMLAAVKK